jgi:hypothetical protein
MAGPGPSPESGIASITPLAAYDENQICDTCERVFGVKAGGPAAAMQEALVYMDAYHDLFPAARRKGYLPMHRPAAATLAEEIMGLFLCGKLEAVAFDYRKFLAAGAGCLWWLSATEQPP